MVKHSNLPSNKSWMNASLIAIPTAHCITCSARYTHKAFERLIFCLQREHKHFAEINKLTNQAPLWFHSIDAVDYVRKFAARIVHGMEDHVRCERLLSLKSDDAKNPAHLANVYSLELALAEMQAHGADGRFLAEDRWANCHMDFRVMLLLLLLMMIVVVFVFFVAR